jgi:phosphatidylserine synthase
MFDHVGRKFAAPIIHRVARRISPRITPLAITGFGLCAGIVCAASASQGWVAVSMVLWIVNRLADGLDGGLARHRNHVPEAPSTTGSKAHPKAQPTELPSPSALGGYFDLMADFVTYAIVPLGIAWHVNSRSAWISLVVLLAVFYVNLGSWTVLAAIQEKRGFGAVATGEPTSITMPTTFVEGTETILAYSAFLLFPGAVPVLFAIFAAMVTVSAGQRMVWAKQHL